MQVSLCCIFLDYIILCLIFFMGSPSTKTKFTVRKMRKSKSSEEDKEGILSKTDKFSQTMGLEPLGY